MNDGGLVYAIFNLTGFDIVYGLGHVHGNGAALGVRHQALGSQYTSYTADGAHHVRRSYANVESEPVLGLDLLYQVIVAHEIGAGGLGFLSLVALGENQHADGLAGTVRQNHGAADLLVGVAGVYAQADRGFDGLVKLGLGGGEHRLNAFAGIVKLLLFDQLYAVLILLAMLHILYSFLW